MTNIIIQALIDAKDTLEIFRSRCSAQEWEKVSAQIAHLQYLATTTEVVAMLPSTITPGDVLPAADTTLLRALQDAHNSHASLTLAELKTHEGITTAGRAIAQASLTPDDSVLSQAVEAAERAKIKSDTLNRSPVYKGRDGKQAVRWVPEAPNHNGLYAFESKKAGDTRNCTINIDDALQFESRELCKAWCDKYPPFMFVPREHMFIGDIA